MTRSTALLVVLCHAPTWFGASLLAQDVPPTVPANESFLELVDELKRKYPGRDAVQASYQVVAAEFRDFIEEHPDSPHVGEARALAAEALLLGGSKDDRDGARELWEEMARTGPRDEDRARGNYSLGEYWFLKHPGEYGKLLQYRKLSTVYFGRVVKLHPNSSYFNAAQRAANFLALARSGKTPEFRGGFVRRGSKDSFEVTRDSLHGKVTMILFWRVSSAGHREFCAQLRAKVAGIEKDYEALRGRIEILGVNLDTNRRLFEGAVDKWNLVEPQFYDGKGYDGAVARAFFVPSAPFYVAIDAQGQLLYAGPTSDHLLAGASGGLKSLRIAREKEATSTAPSKTGAESGTESESRDRNDGEGRDDGEGGSKEKSDETSVGQKSPEPDVKKEEEKEEKEGTTDSRGGDEKSSDDASDSAPCTDPAPRTEAASRADG